MMKTNKLIYNFLYKMGLNIFKIILPLATIPYIYRIINPEIMGKIEFSLSIVGYFSIFAGFGVYTFGLREISRVRDKEDERKKVFSELFIISTISSIIIMIIYFLYIKFYVRNDLILKNMLLLNSLNILSFIFYVEWINEAFENYSFITKKTMIIKIIYVLLIFIFIKTSKDFYKYLLITNLILIINNLISFIYTKENIKINLKNIELKKYIFPLFMIIIISNINILYTNLDKVALGIYSTTTEVAFYSIGQKVMSVVFMIIMTIVSVSMPRLSYYLGNSIDEYIKLLNKILRILSFLIFPMSIGIYILKNEISIFFGGQEYILAGGVVGYFSFRMIFLPYESILSNQIMFLNKKEKVMSLILGICGLLNLLFKYILVKGYFGFEFNGLTAIFTTMLAEILIIILNWIYIKLFLKLNIKLFSKTIISYIILSMLFIPIGNYIKNFNLNYMKTSVLTVIICSIFYLLALLLLKDSLIKEGINMIMIKMKKKK